MYCGLSNPDLIAHPTYPVELKLLGHSLKISYQLVILYELLTQLHPQFLSREASNYAKSGISYLRPSLTLLLAFLLTVMPPRHLSTTNHFQPLVVHPNSFLPPEVRDEFRELNFEFGDVFNPSISKYNGASGKIEAVVNMGPTLPPQRKGRLPQYNRSSMEALQAKFDELEDAGVFAKPEQVNVHVEYLNTSFLVKKPNGGSRLVTSFGQVAQYSKPQPSLMPNVDNVLRAIGQWQYIIVSDLLKSFDQIPLAASSMKYCGVATPYKGIRVYTRSAMGMPGSETCLEELMSRVLGELIQEGCVSKIADDLYIGGNTPSEVLSHWRRVLTLLEKNNLRLSASKTIICSEKTVVLGWIWERVGKESRDRILWSDELLLAFKTAQQALDNHKTITLPQSNDALWMAL